MVSVVACRQRLMIFYIEEVHKPQYWSTVLAFRDWMHDGQVLDGLMSATKAIAALFLGGLLIGGLYGWPFSSGSRETDRSPAEMKALPEALTPDLEGERLVFLSVNTDVAAARLLARWFNDATGATVQVREVAYDRMLPHVLRDSERDAPDYDVVEIWYPTLARLVEEGAIRDLTDLIEANEALLDTEDFLPGVYDAYSRHDGRRWALPYDVDTHLLFYRPSVLERHGLTPPETWSELDRAARRITEAERDSGMVGLASMGYPTPIINVSTFLNRFAARGANFLDDNGRPLLDSGPALEALEQLVAQESWVLASSLETDYEIARDAFLTGRAAMTEQWTDLAQYAQDRRYSTVEDDWGVVPMPRGDGAQGQHSVNLNAGFSLAISDGTTRSEAAEAFVLFASSPEIQKRLNLSGTGIDVGRHSVLESEAFRSRLPQLSRVLGEAWEGAVTPWPVTPRTPDLMASLSDAIADAVARRAEPEEALEHAQSDWLERLDDQGREEP